MCGARDVESVIRLGPGELMAVCGTPGARTCEGSLIDDLARVNLSTPGTDRIRAALDEFSEAPEILLDLASRRSLTPA